LTWVFGGHKIPIKSHEFSEVHFDLKGCGCWPKKVSALCSQACTHRGWLIATVHMTSLLIKLYCWFDFFDSIILIFRWIKLVEPYKVRLDINLGVPDKMMFTQPLSGPGFAKQRSHFGLLQTIYNILIKENPLMGLG